MKRIVLLSIVAGCLAIGCDNSKEERTSSATYRLGMTMTEAQSLMKQAYEVQIAPIEYHPDIPTRDKEYEITEEFAIRVENEGVNLFFNHHKKLIRIEPSSRKNQ